MADGGDFLPFTSFVEERAIDTIEMVRTNMRRQQVPTIQEQAQQFAPILLGRGGLTHSEIDAIGTRIGKQVSNLVQQVVSENPLQPPFKISSGTSTNNSAPEGYRAAPGAQASLVQVEVTGPGSTSVQTVFRIGISLPDTDSADFVVSIGTSPVIEASLREVEPTIGRPFEFRLKLVIEERISELVASASAKSQAALEKGGYR